VPWSAGDCRLEGKATAVACRPPPTDAEGAP
jgi:hypothetical protein